MTEQTTWLIYAALVASAELGFALRFRWRRRVARFARSVQRGLERMDHALGPRLQRGAQLLDEFGGRLEKGMQEAGNELSELAHRGTGVIELGKRVIRGLFFSALWLLLFGLCRGGPYLLTVPLVGAAVICAWEALGAAVEIWRKLRGPDEHEPLPEVFGHAAEASDEQLREKGLLK